MTYYSILHLPPNSSAMCDPFSLALLLSDAISGLSGFTNTRWLGFHSSNSSTSSSSRMSTKYTWPQSMPTATTPNIIPSCALGIKTSEITQKSMYVYIEWVLQSLSKEFEQMPEIHIFLPNANPPPPIQCWFILNICFCGGLETRRSSSNPARANEFFVGGSRVRMKTN